MIKIISKQNKKIILFLTKFFLVFSILFILIEIFPLDFFNNFLTQITASLVGLSYLENKIFFENTTFIVTNLCSGMVSIAIFAGLVFGFKRPILINKIIIFILVSLVLLIVNIFRIIFILIMSINGFDPEFIHQITWYFMSLLILIFWYFSIKKLTIYKKFNELL